MPRFRSRDCTTVPFRGQYCGPPTNSELRTPSRETTKAGIASATPAFCSPDCCVSYDAAVKMSRVSSLSSTQSEYAPKTVPKGHLNRRNPETTIAT